LYILGGYYGINYLGEEERLLGLRMNRKVGMRMSRKCGLTIILLQAMHLAEPDQFMSQRPNRQIYAWATRLEFIDNKRI
jgi:hypothetical protein